MRPARLYMVRHGETAWNAEGRVQGQLDIPLSEVGRAQARAVASLLSGETFSALYSSDLVRVRETAQPLAELLQLPPRLDERLRERHYGVFQGITYAECKSRLPQDYVRFRDKDLDYDFGTGESLRLFNERSLACIGEIAARHPGEEVIVFTHGGVLEMVYRHATGRGLSSPRDFEIPNAALNRLEIGAGGWRVAQWADVGHLSAALDDLAE
jgi:probable phosphoglycerate mutase